MGPVSAGAYLPKSKQNKRFNPLTQCHKEFLRGEGDFLGKSPSRKTFKLTAKSKLIISLKESEVCI